MHPHLNSVLATERHRELLAEAHRRRLAAAASPPVALRLRLGRHLASLGSRIAGTQLIGDMQRSLTREEEGPWKSC